MKKHLLLILLIFLIAGEALWEGLYDIGMKPLSKNIQILWIIGFFTLWTVYKFHWIYSAIYLNFRLLFFDYLYKWISGGKLCGTTSGWYEYVCPVIHSSPIMLLLGFTLIILLINYYELVKFRI